MIEDSARDALATPAAVVEAVVLPAAAEAPLAVSAATLSALKNMVLFFAAPFIALPTSSPFRSWVSAFFRCSRHAPQPISKR